MPIIISGTKTRKRTGKQLKACREKLKRRARNKKVMETQETGNGCPVKESKRVICGSSELFP